MLYYSNSVEHPKHYNFGKYEVIDVIDDWGLDFALGNAIKYIARAGKKSENTIEDLEKALWYINHEIRLQNDPSRKNPSL